MARHRKKLIHASALVAIVHIACTSKQQMRELCQLST